MPTGSAVTLSPPPGHDLPILGRDVRSHPAPRRRDAKTPCVVDPGALELTVGAIAAGGGCVARAPDGRVVFVRHSLPGERVRARVTAETRSFLRAERWRCSSPRPTG